MAALENPHVCIQMGYFCCVLMYGPACANSKPSGKCCWRSTGCDEKSQLCQLQDGLVATIQHLKKEKWKVKLIAGFYTRALITDKKKQTNQQVFMLKRYRRPRVPDCKFHYRPSPSCKRFLLQWASLGLVVKLCSLLFAMTCWGTYQSGVLHPFPTHEITIESTGNKHVPGPSFMFPHRKG